MGGMASITQTPAGAFQLRIKNKLLPKILWATFDTREQAEAYGRQLEGLLAQGIVPSALLERSAAKVEIWTVSRCVAEYLKNNSVPHSDIKVLDTLRPWQHRPAVRELAAAIGVAGGNSATRSRITVM